MTVSAQDNDAFALSLLEESKRFLEKTSSADADGKEAFLHAAILLAFCSLEAHINAIADDFASEMELTPHELGLLRELEVRLENGRFEVTNVLRMVRLEDRIKFICVRFARKKVDFTEPWWSRLAEATKLRNALIHPKGHVLLEVKAVSLAIEAIIDTLNAVYSGVFDRPFPAVGLQLDSRLTF